MNFVAEFVTPSTDSYRRIAPYIRKTPLEYSPYFSAATKAKVYLKLENQQVTGSFKARGALTKLTSLTAAEREKGVVTASSGNHGAAVAYGMKQLGIGGEIWVPENVAPTKRENILGNLEGSRGEIRYYGLDSGHTEIYARRRAEETGRTYVSPYNDWEIIAGQGTTALEIEEQLGGPPDALFSSVGGGGLIVACAGFFRARAPALLTVASSPVASAAMAESLRQGKVVAIQSEPTLSDGTAGDIEPGCVTFDYCREFIDAFPLLSEPEIAEAMRAAIEHHHLLIEGSAGVALASLAKVKERIAGKTVVVLVCGGNVSLATLRSVLV